MAFPVDRRAFLQTGLAAVGGFLAVSRRSSMAGYLQDLGNTPLWTPIAQSAPILPIARSSASVVVGGVPFAPTWFGDNFPSGGFPFHASETPRRWAALDEHVDVAIVGGGLSGLSTAHYLGHRDWVLFDLRSRFGGVAQGERWNAIPYSLGSAYFMVPDEGSADDRLYSYLGVYDLAQIDRGGGFQFEFGGKILTDVCNGCTPREAAAIEAYAAAVSYYGNVQYPDIPWEDPQARQLVMHLDGLTFQQSVQDACGGEVPWLLAAAIQGYCYSSFGVGWGELSAAAGWNFIAAEEFGRIVLPGANAGLATLLWSRLRAQGNMSSGKPRLRAGCMVTNIQLVPEGVAISWRDALGGVHTMGAKRVVYAASKHILGHMMPQIETLDGDKWDAMHQVRTTPYVVANVLLNTRVSQEFYDLFSIHDNRFPMDGNEFEQDSRITDAVNGSFAVASRHPDADVLTLYWPLPWHTARFTLVTPESFNDYATRAAPQIEQLLSYFGLTAGDVAQVRLTRWGHAMPYAWPGAYLSGIGERMRRPLGGERLWFANQDNWSLPAVETCLAEARWVARSIG